MKKASLCAVIVLLFICYSMVNASETVSRETSKGKINVAETPPVVIKSAAPIYPNLARVDSAEGFVILKITVTKDGEIINPEVVESFPKGYFEASAIETLKKFKIKPATRNGVPVETTVSLPFIFSFMGASFAEDASLSIQAYRRANRGMALIEKNEYKKAVEEFSEAINLNSRYTTAYYYRSLSFMEMEEYEKAMEDIERAIRLSRRTWGFYNHRGLIHLFSENYQDAIQDFNRTIKNEPENMMAYIHRGDAYRMDESYQEAIRDYTSALAFNENLIHVYNNRGYSYLMLNENYDACNDFERACELGDCRGFEYMKRQGVCSLEDAGSGGD